MTISQDELNDKIDQLYKLRKELSEWNSLCSDLKEQAREIETEVVEAMSDIGLSKAGTTTANISISSQIVPTVDTDFWSEIRRWIMDNDYEALLPRSLNQAAYRELVQMGIEIPHVENFDKVKVSVTKAK
jgi:hypothetical protein